jgi:hypothetical protein
MPQAEYRRQRTKSVLWDEVGRTLSWDEEEAREEAEAQAAREAKRERLEKERERREKERERLEKERERLRDERRRLLELLQQNTRELERAG